MVIGNSVSETENWASIQDFSTYRICLNAFDYKIAFISLPINLNMCFGCSKEPSRIDGSFEYPQHMFWLSNKKNNFPVHTLIWRPVIGNSVSETENWASIQAFSTYHICVNAFD